MGRRKWLWQPERWPRRFNSDDAARPNEEKTTDETVTESPSEATAATSSAEQSSTDALSQAAEAVGETIESAGEAAADQAAAAASAVGSAAAQAVGDERPRQFYPSDDRKRTLYVGNMYFQTTQDQLRQEFSPFGKIMRTAIIRDTAGLSRGFGYVEFETEEAAEEAIVQMNQRVLDGRRLVVQHHKRREPEDGPRRYTQRNNSRPSNPPSKTLFIGNMSFEMSDRDLNDLFRDIRNVLDVRVAIDRRTGQPRGFAHADFIDETSATKAKEVLAEREVYGRKLRVDYTRSARNNR
ncbi:putative nucleic acid-binding protein [Neofusicoccum parvum UCRNP2]|uniref:MFS pantothenate transporter n=2 Tax=Neofusicoccum parvum TaxID=310453 RepID=A0ACB5SGS9_9PEZI|nr:putative nucleic acid-binding protein [Neofusicoccum parvum UCRNP2]GME40308.1 MFS pantothenate transporter [Neofusicoccum parvum]